MERVSGALAPIRWLRLAPCVFVVYSIAIVDRVNFGFGAAGGMAHDLGITEGRNALLGALFFLGNFFCQIPAAHYASRYSARRLIFVSMVLWGLLAAGTGMITNLPLLFADRFLLGVVESAVFPGLLVFLSHWFTKPERSRATSMMILGNPVTLLWMSVLSGYLVDQFGWRWMFIIEGAPAVAFAFVWYRLVNDHPAQAGWLAPEERTTIEDMLSREQDVIEPIGNYRQALVKPTVILLALQYMCWSIGSSGLTLWLPAILKAGSSYGMTGIGWLSAAPYLLGAVAMFSGSFLSDKLRVRWPFVSPFLFIAATGFFTSYMFGIVNFWGAYAAIVLAAAALYVPYGPFFAAVPEVLPRNVVGVAFALINSVGGLGAFTGAYLVGYLNARTGGPAASFLLLAGALLAASVIGMFVGKPRSARTAGYRPRSLPSSP